MGRGSLISEKSFVLSGPTWPLGASRAYRADTERTRAPFSKAGLFAAPDSDAPGAVKAASFDGFAALAGAGGLVGFGLAQVMPADIGLLDDRRQGLEAGQDGDLKPVAAFSFREAAARAFEEKAAVAVPVAALAGDKGAEPWGLWGDFSVSWAGAPPTRADADEGPGCSCSASVALWPSVGNVAVVENGGPVAARTDNPGRPLQVMAGAEQRPVNRVFFDIGRARGFEVYARPLILVRPVHRARPAAARVGLDADKDAPPAPTGQRFPIRAHGASFPVAAFLGGATISPPPSASPADGSSPGKSSARRRRSTNRSDASRAAAPHASCSTAWITRTSARRT